MSIPMTGKSPRVSDEELVELRRWWDAFGADNTPLAVKQMCEEYIAARSLAEARRRQLVNLRLQIGALADVRIPDGEGGIVWRDRLIKIAALVKETP
jgi:hypothetical protein